MLHDIVITCTPLVKAQYIYMSMVSGNYTQLAILDLMGNY